MDFGSRWAECAFVYPVIRLERLQRWVAELKPAFSRAVVQPVDYREQFRRFAQSIWIAKAGAGMKLGRLRTPASVFPNALEVTGSGAARLKAPWASSD